VSEPSAPKNVPPLALGLTLDFVIASVVVFGAILWNRTDSEADLVRCQSNPGNLGKRMGLYLLNFGGSSLHPVSAPQFRGSDWFAILYWKYIVGDPNVFHCPACRDVPEFSELDTNEDTVLVEYDRLGNWDGSHSGPFIEYGARGRHPGAVGKSTIAFSESDLTVDKMMACDLPRNHGSGINAACFDSQVEFLPYAEQLRLMDHPREGLVWPAPFREDR
jgi:hypothetical protein